MQCSPEKKDRFAIALSILSGYFKDKFEKWKIGPFLPDYIALLPLGGLFRFDTQSTPVNADSPNLGL